MTAAAEVDSTFARWTYAQYFQFVRDNDSVTRVGYVCLRMAVCVCMSDISE